MDAVQKYVDEHHDMLVKIGCLLAFMFLVVYVPANSYLSLRQEIQEHVDNEVELQDKIDELNEQVAYYKQNFEKTAFVRRETECLAKNIYYEAGSTSDEGMRAVAQVTLNRKRAHFAKTICGVVYQKNIIYEKVICQFSWYCETGHKTRAVYTPLWRESEEVAKKVLLENFRLPSLKNALYFHAEHVSPSWGKPKIEKIGRHIFYGERT